MTSTTAAHTMTPHISPKIEALLQTISTCQCDDSNADDIWMTPDLLTVNHQPSIDDVFNARILVVDDEPVNAKLVRKYLLMSNFTNVDIECDPFAVVPALLNTPADLIILDVVMPGLSGGEVLTRMRDEPQLRDTSVVVLTSDISRQTRLDMLNRGASDFLAKPVDPVETSTRIRNALVNVAYRKHWKQYAQDLEKAVTKRSQALVRSQFELLRCLARAAEFRDDETGQHVIRVGKFAGLLARKLGMNRVYVDMIHHAAQLHDVGKIGVPDSILLKPGRLTPSEFDVMRQHCEFGTGIFGVRSPDNLITDTEINFPESKDAPTQTPFSVSQLGVNANLLRLATSPLTRMAALIALTHHEKWDGSGYPLGLAGEEIPLEGRITALADVFDALSSKRPYKEAFSFERCFSIIGEGRGTHFDPQIVDAFLQHRDEFAEIRKRFPE